ncbi:MAG TPA: hypothetical protein VFE50_25255 [Cyclobacteriaceae bacterium]|nr:hypothetical protein [Cyclobacteriaceae bacterium]
MKKIPTLILLALVVTSCHSDNESAQRILKLEEIVATMSLRIDSLMIAVDSLKLQSMRNENTAVARSKSTVESSTLTPPLFINQTVDQIKKYWETRISVQYFDEGTFTGSDKKYFDIMYGNIGTPEFTSSFDESGLCESHATKIAFSDISVVQAKLRNAGYSYSDAARVWTNARQQITWSILPEGKFYVLRCERK